MPYSLLLVFALFQPQADWQPTLRNLEWREVKSLWVTVDASRPIEGWLDAQQRTQFSCNLAHGKILPGGEGDTLPWSIGTTGRAISIRYYGVEISSNLCDPVQLPAGLSSEDAMQFMFRSFMGSMTWQQRYQEEREDHWHKVVASYEKMVSILRKQAETYEQGIKELRSLLGNYNGNGRDPNSVIKQ